MQSLLSKNAKVKRGDTFQFLTVVGDPFWVRIKAKERISHVVMQCHCGRRTIIPVVQIIRSRPVRTCGCRVGTEQWQHGEADTRLFKIYNGIRQRCFNKNRIAFKDYGGRGILLCDEWHKDYLKFKEWSLANGYADDLSIDRIDNNLGYSPDNCRWTTHVVQMNNSRRNLKLDAFGETKTLSEWARDSRCKVSYAGLVNRFKSWRRQSGEAILSRPTRSGQRP